MCVCVISVSILLAWKIVAGFGNNNGQFNFVFTEEKGCVADLNVSKFFKLDIMAVFSMEQNKNMLKQIHLGFNIKYFSLWKKLMKKIHNFSLAFCESDFLNFSWR